MIMPPPHSRRQILCSAGIVSSIGLAGCLGGAISDVYLTDGVAKERALEAEESYLVERLENASCLTGWGTSETTAQTTASVADRTAEGVVVDVTHAYWYSTEKAEADGASEARYVITDDDTRRIHGETVSPC